MSYFNTNPGQVEYVTSDWVLENTGLDPATTPPAELAAAGFYLMVVEPEPAYNPELTYLQQTQGIVGTNYVVAYVIKPFSKETYTSAVNSEAYSILLPTDWLVVRKVENGTEIPPEWNTWRQSIRDEAALKIITIDDTRTDQQLIDYVESPAYTYWPPEPASPAQATEVS